jgi:hypothetical protein
MTPQVLEAKTLGVCEIRRRLDFLEQMRPEKRNKPRNVKRMAALRAALVMA